jgi:hypothetical protein
MGIGGRISSGSSIEAASVTHLLHGGLLDDRFEPSARIIKVFCGATMAFRFLRPFTGEVAREAGRR